MSRVYVAANKKSESISLFSNHSMNFPLLIYQTASRMTQQRNQKLTKFQMTMQSIRRPTRSGSTVQTLLQVEPTMVPTIKAARFLRVTILQPMTSIRQVSKVLPVRASNLILFVTTYDCVILVGTVRET